MMFGCSNANAVASSVSLVRRLVALLEALERLPVYTHDVPGTPPNLQVCGGDAFLIGCMPSALSNQMVHRRLRFNLERAPGDTTLLDRSGRVLKIEPLVSVEGLEKFLNGLVSLPLLCHSVYMFGAS